MTHPSTRLATSPSMKNRVMGPPAPCPGAVCWGSVGGVMGLLVLSFCGNLVRFILCAHRNSVALKLVKLNTPEQTKHYILIPHLGKITCDLVPYWSKFCQAKIRSQKASQK